MTIRTPGHPCSDGKLLCSVGDTVLLDVLDEVTELPTTGVSDTMLSSGCDIPGVLCPFWAMFVLRI